MVYSQQLQATHCRQAPAWTGRWFSPRGDRWFRVSVIGKHPPDGEPKVVPLSIG
jgi:hypothetical protein